MILSTRIALCAALLCSFASTQETTGAQPQKGPQEQKAAPATGHSNDWFSQTDQDLGKYLEGEVARGHWDFKNPHDNEVTISGFRPSCTCSKVVLHVGDQRYELQNDPRPHSMYRVDKVDGAEKRVLVDAIPVAAHEEGRIDVEIDLRGVQGPKHASVTVYTSDDKNPMLVVNATALATQYFQVMPAEVNLNEMSWQDKREFTARITSPIRPDFQITGVDPLPDGMKVDYEKEMMGDQAVWVIHGTYGPNLDPSASGGLVNFQTDLEGRKAQLRVIAFVKGPLEIRPGTYIQFGRIKHGEGASQTVEFEPTGDFDLDVKSVEFKNLTLPESDISYETAKDGKILKLTFKISADAPKRLVRGDITVHLNHPAVPEKHLQFSGFVR